MVGTSTAGQLCPWAHGWMECAVRNDECYTVSTKLEV
jgi:hypothetical protein